MMMHKHGRLAWWLLWLSLICCVFEGAGRKWVFGDGSIAGRLAYLSKDLVMAAFLVLGPGRSSPLTRAAWPYLMAGLVLLGLGAAGSAASGIEPVGAVLTIRTFFVLPLAALAAARLLPADALQRYARWIVVLALPMSLLGVRQFYSPPDSAINRYSTVGENVATAGIGGRDTGERIRATGTFSYLSGLSEFSTAAVWGAIVTLTLARTRRDRWLGIAGLIAGFVCAFVTISRAVALVAVGLLAVWALAGGGYGRKVQLALMTGLTLIGLIAFAEQWDTATEIATTVYLRHQASRNDTFSHRLWYQFILPMSAVGASPFGNGLGTQQVVTSLSADSLRQTTATVIESAWGRTIMELGLLGLGGFVLTLAMVFMPLERAYRSAPRGTGAILLSVTLAALLARALPGIPFNHVASYFFWAMAAATLALYNRPPTAPLNTLAYRHRQLPTSPVARKTHSNSPPAGEPVR